MNITEKVQTHAYYLWKEAGEPKGEAMNFWLMAEKFSLPPNGFVGKTVIVKYEGHDLHILIENSTATDCRGVVVNEPQDCLGIIAGDEIIFVPDEIIEILEK